VLAGHERLNERRASVIRRSSTNVVALGLFAIVGVL